jgi:outer membrane protein assembly factor BamB
VTVDAAGSRLEAREAHDGRVLWRTPFPAGAQCSPVLDGRRLLAMCASQREIDALDVRTPELRTLDKASGKLGGPLALAGRYVPVGAAGGRLVLLREHTEGTAMTGYDAVALADPAGHAVTYTRLRLYAGNVRVADGTVYVTGQTGRVTAIDPADGRVKWSRQTAVEGASGPVAGRNALYFSSASGRVVALGRSDGKILWNTGPRVDGVTGEGDGRARVAVAGDALVVAAAGNTLFAFDARKPPKAG